MKKVLLLATTLVVGILIGTLVMGTAMAATPTPQGTATPTVPCADGSACGRVGVGRGVMGNGGARGAMMGGQMGAEEEILTLLNMTSEQLSADRQTGKSLVQIAQAKGVTEQQLVNTILAAKRADLDALVRDGKLTQAQADQMYQNMQQAVSQAVNRTTSGPMWGNGNGTAGDCPIDDDAQTPGQSLQQNGRPGRGGMMRGGRQ